MNRRHALRAAAAVCLAWSLPRAHAHSKNATDAIRRVASNEFDFGFVDGSVNMRAAMQGKEPSPVYLFAIFDRSPACIVTWKTSGIRKPADLAGKSIIATPGDGAIGFDTTIFYKLRDMGTKLEELDFMYCADGGLELYSNGIVVSQRMLREQRDRVAAMVRACARGWRDAIGNPREAVDALAKVGPGIDKATEVARFEWIRERQVLTPAVRVNGLGVVDVARLRRLAAQIAGPSATSQPFAVETVFDASFLPALADRAV